MKIFKAAKRQTKSIGILDNSSKYNDDMISYHKLYRTYYPKYNDRTDILGTKVSDYINIDDTTDIELVREGRNRYYSLYNKKFYRVKRSNNFPFKRFRLTCYWINNYYYFMSADD